MFSEKTLELTVKNLLKQKEEQIKNELLEQFVNEYTEALTKAVSEVAIKTQTFVEAHNGRQVLEFRLTIDSPANNE